MRTLITFCSQHPLEILLSAFELFLAHDPADPMWRDRMANVATVATLDPVGAVQTIALCLDALYRLQIFQSQATAQLVDQAQALHLTIQLRDEQLQEASAEIESRGALITQLHGQVHEL